MEHKWIINGMTYSRTLWHIRIYLWSIIFIIINQACVLMISLLLTIDYQTGLRWTPKQTRHVHVGIHLGTTLFINYTKSYMYKTLENFECKTWSNVSKHCVCMPSINLMSGKRAIWIFFFSLIHVYTLHIPLVLKYSLYLHSTCRFIIDVWRKK